MKHLLTVLFAVMALSGSRAQPAERYIKVTVTPGRDGWVYSPGEKVKFDISVTKNSLPLENSVITYELSEDMMAPFKTGSATLKGGKITIDAGTLKNPGFIRCSVRTRYDGFDYEGTATGAFDPESIRPTTTLPEDFEEFWRKAKEDNDRIPMDATMSLIPEKCTGKVDVYHVSLQNYGYGARVYGILCIPKGSGNFPAVVSFPGAGVSPHDGDMTGAENGFITFRIGIHGIPVDMPRKYYDELAAGPLNDYPRIRLDDRDNYYYKRVYLGCIRAVDFIYSLPQFDGNNLCVQGGSQGGALSIVTAALDDRVKCLVAYYPALCDLTGYLHERAGGWPHLFRKDGPSFSDEQVETSRYYDVVNFARILKTPGFYTWGYNDMVCPPTSMYSAYNVIAAPKELFLAQETGHYNYPEQWVKAWEWMISELKR